MSEHFLMQESDYEKLDDEARKRLDRLFYQCHVLLGGVGVEVELEDPDYHVAFERALSIYRTYSSRSVYRSYGFLTLEPAKSIYTLDQMVDVVIRIWRFRGSMGGLGAGAAGFEPFGAATANILMRGGTNNSGSGFDLASYDFMLQYQETISKLFAHEIQFTYRNETNQIILTQTPRGDETVIVECSVLKSIKETLNDHWAYDWLQRYCLAQLRTILGEKYSVFATIPGAQGGTVTKGEALKQQGNEDMERLRDELSVYGDSSDIPVAIRG